MKGFLIIFLAIGVLSATYSQQPDPYEILDSLKKELEKIDDYTADVEIEVDVDFINMPVKHAQIFFKKPDKIKFKSKEFIMLPKRGVNNSFSQILNEPFTAIYSGNEQINNEEHILVKIIPLSKKPDIILATWWINTKSNVVSKVESNTRKEGTYQVDFFYNDSTHTLPTELAISFEIEKMRLPLSFIGKSSGKEMDESKMLDKQKGKVYIRFSNYKINTKLSNDLFIEDQNTQ